MLGLAVDLSATAYRYCKAPGHVLVCCTIKLEKDNWDHWHGCVVPRGRGGKKIPSVGHGIGFQPSRGSVLWLPQLVSTCMLASSLQALSYLHSQQIAHRDIKPPNIFFAADYTLKLADFGVAINLASEAAVTQTGTRPYMAPEVQRTPLKRTAEENKAIQALQYDISADIWWAGHLGVYCLTQLHDLHFASPGTACMQPRRQSAATRSNLPAPACGAGRVVIATMKLAYIGQRPRLLWQVSQT